MSNRVRLPLSRVNDKAHNMDGVDRDLTWVPHRNKATESNSDVRNLLLGVQSRPELAGLLALPHI
jgi:hypothetical protein